MLTEADIAEAARLWAADRYDDLLTREYGFSLDVGPAKPLGSQGYGMDWPSVWAFTKAIWRATRRRQGHAYFFTPERDIVWVYVWDPAAMRRLLGPVGLMPRDFVAGIRTDIEPAGTGWYNLIADAYGDRLNPGRFDVLPGVPRRVLLAAFRDLTGRPDPAWIYFPPADLPDGYPRKDGA